MKLLPASNQNDPCNFFVGCYFLSPYFIKVLRTKFLKSIQEPWIVEKKEKSVCKVLVKYSIKKIVKFATQIL